MTIPSLLTLPLPLLLLLLLLLSLLYYCYYYYYWSGGASRGSAVRSRSASRRGSRWTLDGFGTQPPPHSALSLEKLKLRGQSRLNNAEGNTFLFVLFSSFSLLCFNCLNVWFSCLFRKSDSCSYSSMLISKIFIRPCAKTGSRDFRYRGQATRHRCP